MEQLPRPMPDCPVLAAGLSSMTPDSLVAKLESPVKQPRFEFPNQTLTKSCPIFTRFCTGYLDPIPKLFPKDLLKKIMGLAAISDLVKKAIFGQDG